MKHDAPESNARDVVQTGGLSDENAGARAECDEDEEGWTSDQSGGSAYMSGDLHAEHKKRRKMKGITHSASVRNTRNHRRRHPDGGSFSSHAKQLLDQPTLPVEPPSENPPAEDDDDLRGRSYVPHRQGSGHTSRRSIQHRRLESLRTSEQNSRDVSPTRSVRFIDEEPRNGAGTPRTLPDQTIQGSSVVEPSTGDDADPRGKVMFDLTPRRTSLD